MKTINPAMRKLIMQTIFLTTAMQAVAQTGNNVKTDGNVLNPGDKIGSTNNENVSFMTNGQTHTILKKNGDLRLLSFDNGHNGLVLNNTNGVFSKISLTGSAADVFTGNGTFAPISSFTGWTLSGSTLSTTHNVEINGTALFTGKARFARIAPMPGDSLIRFGDSTVYLDHTNNRIYATTSGVPALPAGLGIGSSTVTTSCAECVAIGSNSEINNQQGITMGTYLKSTNTRSITIGSGYNTTHLVNNIANSLMVGFNSNVPTLYIGPGSGLNTMGKVGIGTTSPTGDFQLLKSSAASLYISSSGASNARLYVTNSAQAYTFGVNSTGIGEITNGTTPIISFAHGNVGIGTQCLPYGYGFKLSVDGKIVCEEVKVKMSNGSGCWPDYVFDKDYVLTSLDELEAQIMNEKHLPGFKSAREIENDGLELAETIRLQQQKIEELTLYVIELNKKLEGMGKK